MTKQSHIEQLLRDLCPQGVKRKKLGEVCITLPKGTLKTTELTNNGYPVINSGKTLYGYYSQYNNNCEAITIAARGEYAGWISYFDEKFWAGGLCYPYTSKDEKVLKTKFLYYWLKKEENNIMDSLVARGGIPALNKTDVDRILIPIPSIAIQEEFVRVLDTFVNLIDNLDIEIAERQKELVLCRRHILNNLDCETKPISSLFLLRGGYTPSTKNPEFWTETGGYPWYTMDDIRQNGRKLDESFRHITEKAIKGKGLFPAGTIVFATSATIGEHAILTRPALTNQRFTALIPKSDNVYMPFYYHYGFIIDEWCLQHIKQGGFASVDMNGFANLQIPLPSLKEQQAIAAKLDTIEAFIANLNEERTLRQQQYEYYRAKLISLLK